MPVEPFAPIVAGLHQVDSSHDTAASPGDWLAVLGLIVVVFFVIAEMISVANDKRKTLKEGDLAPRQGEYVGEARAYHGRGRKIAPAANTEWRLKEAHFGEPWLWIVILLCVIGALCYSRINVPHAEEAVSHALSPVVSPPPAPRVIDHRIQHHALHQPHRANVHSSRHPRAHHRGA